MRLRDLSLFRSKILSPPDKMVMKDRKQLMLSLYFIVSGTLAQQQDPSTINGGSMMAMTGKECAVLAIDKRFGNGPQMTTVSPRRCLLINSKLIVGFTGLDGDVQSIAEELSVNVAKKISQETNGLDGIYQRKAITPRAMSTLTSHILYSKRSSPSFCEPLILGLERYLNNGGDCSKIKSENNFNGFDKRKSKWMQQRMDARHKISYRPFICISDMLGAQTRCRDFACAGAATNSMYGIAEAMWQPDMNKEQLVKVCGRAFLSALERDCLSGYGAILYLITPDGIEEYDLSCQND